MMHPFQKVKMDNNSMNVVFCIKNKQKNTFDTIKSKMLK